MRRRRGIVDEAGRVCIYYASSDTRMHVATTTIDQLLDYIVNTPGDGMNTAASVEALQQLIDKNKAHLQNERIYLQEGSRK